jgi:integrase
VHLANYLADLFSSGLSAGSLNVHKSAIVFILCQENDVFASFNSSHQLRSILKGAFNARPPRVKRGIWNVDTVVTFLRSLGPNESLTLVLLLRKCVTLFALVTACRVAELASFSRKIKKESEGWLFSLNEWKKSSSSKRQDVSIKVFFFQDPILCPLNCLARYLSLTSSLCKANVDNLFLTLTKPVRPASANTLARHLKWVLQEAGIDINQFKAHSFRSASTSQALSQGIPVAEILSRASWASESTFCKFYAREILEGKAFSDSVLGQ